MIEFEVVFGGETYEISTEKYFKIVDLCNTCPNYSKEEGNILLQRGVLDEYVLLIDNLNDFVHDIQLNGDTSFRFFVTENDKQVVLDYDKSLELKRLLA
jgi:hypothetical protein